MFYFQTIIILILSALLLKCCDKKLQTCSNLNFETSPNGISAIKADSMEELYKDKQYTFLNEKFGYMDEGENRDYSDNREYWFPLKELKSYLCYIEAKADSFNYDKNTLGIRVYNAAKRESCHVKSSIFMIGTYRTEVELAQASFNVLNMFNTTLVNDTKNINFGKDTKAFNYGTSGKEPKYNGAVEYESK